MPRREFPKPVKVARLKHATDAKGNIYCEGCGVLIKPGMFAFDHNDADGLTGEPTFDNCRVLCVAVCHAAKTAEDQAKIAKAKRREADHLGIRTAKSAIPQRPRAAKPVRDKAPVPPRRPMFVKDERPA